MRQGIQPAEVNADGNRRMQVSELPSSGCLIFWRAAKCSDKSLSQIYRISHGRARGNSSAQHAMS
jgi:hypothetical protein